MNATIVNVEAVLEQQQQTIVTESSDRGQLDITELDAVGGGVALGCL